MNSSFHKLAGSWILWAHLPQLNDWSLSSYVKLYKITCMEEVIAIMEALPPIMIQTCMLFLMREGINPIWEDPRNVTGGCFSYKIGESYVCSVWKELSYIVCGETTSTTTKTFNEKVNGITISPKKHFCIIKIWTSTCEYQSPSVVSSEITQLIPKGCLFKKHTD